MIKIAVSFTFVFLLAAIPSFKCQELLHSGKNEFFGGGLTVGYGYQDVSALQSLVPDNIKKFSENHFVIGAMGYGVKNNFVIGAGGFGITGEEVVTDSLKVSLGGGMGTFNFGYMIVNREHFKLFPLIGIGGYSYGIKMNRNGNVSVRELTQHPSQEINLSTATFVTDISININFIPGLQRDEKKNSSQGYLTGLKIGYVYSIPNSKWTYSGGDIIGGPEFGLNMAYVKLIMGGFGSREKNNTH